MTDSALGFWLRTVESAGGIAEPADDATLVLLPAPLAETYGLPEELYVTADPDVAREDGITFLGSGHPVLTQAASALLDAGDPGHRTLDRPPGALPSRDALLEEARDAFPVDHGRIDLSGEPTVVTHPVVRVGALVTYELSTEDRFQEQDERWVDVPARRELSGKVSSRLSSAAVDPRSGSPVAEGGLLPALAEAHRLVDAAAAARREALALQLGGAHDAERSRAIGYYTDVIAGVEKRLATAPDDRRAVLMARLDSVREEQARRLAEIAEKYEARHEIRPYRLHLIGVPALRVPVDVRRGDRRYPMRFDWLLPAREYAPVRCPSCNDMAPLVAGKKNLGCTVCLPKPAPSVPAPRSKPVTAPAPAASPKAPTRPAPARPAEPSESPTAPPRARPAKPKAARAVPAPRKPAKVAGAARLAEDLWRALAAGDDRKISGLLAPATPAYALYRAFGTTGLTGALGLNMGELPSHFNARTESTDGMTVIRGDLVGERGTECAYNLYLRDGRVAEALPFPVYSDGRFWNMYWWGHGPSRSRVTAPGIFASDLDPVEKTLSRTGPSWNGLAVVARALAAWARLAEHHERLSAAHDPKVLAAAAHRLVTYRAGDRATFADGAATYRVDERLMRKADAAMRGPLSLGPGRPW